MICPRCNVLMKTVVVRDDKEVYVCPVCGYMYMVLKGPKGGGER